MSDKFEGEELLGRTGTVIIRWEGGLSWVIGGRIVSDRDLARMGLRMEGHGWKPRRVVAAPTEDPWLKEPFTEDERKAVEDGEGTEPW